MNPLRLFAVEIALAVLAVSSLALEAMIRRDDAERGRKLGRFAMTGIALTFALLVSQWGAFGTALGGTFVQDGLAFFFKGLFLAAGFVAVFLANHYQSRLDRGHAELTLLVLFSLVGMCVLASSADFVLFFVALETLTVSLYVMTAYLRGRASSLEAGVKYLVLGALSTAVFLYGLSFLYGAAGSTSFAAIADAGAGRGSASFTFGMVLVTAALGFKIAAVPFQLWAPDIYEGAPTPVTAYLAIGSKAAGFAALTRLALEVFAPQQAVLAGLLAVLSALTLLYGNLGAVPQTNLKRLLAYSSIGHAGYLLMGLAASGTDGVQAVLVYLAVYLVSTAGAFLVLVALTRHLERDAISELAGLSRRSPLLAAGMMIGLLSLAGLPPLGGFFAKFYLFWAAVKSGLTWLVWIGLAGALVSLYYYLGVVKTMYVDKPAGTAPIVLTASQRRMQWAAILLVVFFGVAQGPLVRLAEAAVSGLF